MKRAPTVGGIVVLALTQLSGQSTIKQDTGHGACNPAVVAGGNVTIECSGLDPEQLSIIKRLPDLIGKVVQQNHQDSLKILGKLEELVNVRRTPPELTVTAAPGVDWGLFERTGDLRIKLNLKNIGGTSARYIQKAYSLNVWELEGADTVAAFDKNLPDEPFPAVESPDQSSDVILEPGGEMSLFAVLANSAERLRQFVPHPSNKVVIFGTVTYKDDLGKDHQTQFCRIELYLTEGLYICPSKRLKPNNF